MAIKVNNDLCIGCGTCEVICPATFKLNAEAKVDVISQADNPCAKEAAESCPTQAIEIK